MATAQLMFRVLGRFQLTAVCISGILQSVVELLFSSADEAAQKQGIN